MSNKMYKQEILDAIANHQFSYEDFEHSLEDCARTSAMKTYSFHSKHLLINFELTEHVIWDSYDNFELDNYELGFFEALDQEGIDYADRVTEDEILNHINI